MNNSSTRTQRREEKYAHLKACGIQKTSDTLYLKEMDRLRNKGYSVRKVRKHEFIKNFWYCVVTFPKDN